MNDTTLPDAKELARHSEFKMALRYTHIGMRDQENAAANRSNPYLSNP